MSKMAPRSRGGRWVVVPDNHSTSRARLLARHRRRRRARIMAALVTAALASGAWAITGAVVAISINLVIDASAVIYGAAMYESNRRRREQRRKVRSIARHPLSRSHWADEEPVAL